MISASDNDSSQNESTVNLVYEIDDTNQELDNLMLRKYLLRKMLNIFKTNEESEKRKEIEVFKHKVTRALAGSR